MNVLRLLNQWKANLVDVLSFIVKNITKTGILKSVSKGKFQGRQITNNLIITKKNKKKQRNICRSLCNRKFQCSNWITLQQIIWINLFDEAEMPKICFSQHNFIERQSVIARLVLTVIQAPPKSPQAHTAYQEHH